MAWAILRLYHYVPGHGATNNELRKSPLINKYVILAIDFPGGKRNRNKKIRAQLRILSAIVKEESRKVLKHVY